MWYWTKVLFLILIGAVAVWLSAVVTRNGQHVLPRRVIPQRQAVAADISS